MSSIVDNLIAYRILYLLVTPFVETEAYKLGIIDAKGKNLIKSRDFTTTEQKNAYTYLHRLVFNLKKILIRLPGGDARLKNIVAGFFLVKEAYQTKKMSISEQQVKEIVSLLESGAILCEEQLDVEEFLLQEEGPANVTGPAVSTDQPVIRKRKRKFGRFVVNDEIYSRFANGKAKFRKWNEYLNLENDGERMIYNFAKKNPDGVIILHNGSEQKAIRFNRRGGGSWSKIKRQRKQTSDDNV